MEILRRGAARAKLKPGRGAVINLLREWQRECIFYIFWGGERGEVETTSLFQLIVSTIYANCEHAIIRSAIILKHWTKLNQYLTTLNQSINAIIINYLKVSISKIFMNII